MKPNKQLFLPLLLFIINISIAQTTAIPDENFEQALIDLGIDSDNTVNGQVLTADIENIIELELSNDNNSATFIQEITDFTGIEDFTALEVLSLIDVQVNLSEDQADVFNSNSNLREFRALDSSFDTYPFIIIQHLDFNNLNNLEYISLYNSFQINSINLNNPNSSYENLTIDLSHEYWDPPTTYTVCINVSDAQAASSDQYPYNTWDVIAPAPDTNGYVWRDYEFSSSCNLSTADFDQQTKIEVYPNPVKDKLWFDNPNQIHIDKAEVYDMTGKRVKSFSSSDEAINLESLEQGIYFVKVMSKNRTKTFKVMKE